MRLSRAAGKLPTMMTRRIRSLAYRSAAIGLAVLAGMQEWAALARCRLGRARLSRPGV